MSNKRIERLNKWVKALESGKYKKGRYQLKSGNKSPEYCCLGVACEIFPNKVKGNQGGNFLTLKSLKFLGISDKDQNRLANINDGRDSLYPRITFRGIAKYIRENIIRKTT